MFIWYRMPGTVLKRWYLVQAPAGPLPEDFLQTKKLLVRWYVRHFKDSRTKIIQDCRFWPEIHELKANATFGRIVPINPTRVGARLKRDHNIAAYEKVVDLDVHLLHGPFNWFDKDEGATLCNTIHPRDWVALKVQARKEDVDISDLDTVVPLH